MALNGEPEHFRGTLLLRDIRTTYLLVNHARHQSIYRVFGQPHEQDNILTLMAAALMATAVHTGYRRCIEALPTGPDWALGTAGLSEAAREVAGPASRKGPMLGTLLLAVFLAGGARPIVRKALGGALGEERRLTFDFHHRYGYLIDPGHWRQRRAERQQQARAIGKPAGVNA